MNSFNYFRPLAYKVKGVPSKNQPLFNWSLFQIRQANVSYDTQLACLEHASCLLQDDQKEQLSFRKEFKQYMQSVRPKFLTFWFRECLDFPLFVLIYTTGIQIVYTQVLMPLLEQRPIQGEVEMGWTMVLQTLSVYLIYKGLLTYMATDPRRSSLVFWIVIMAVFALYLGTLYLAGQVSGTWWTCPLWLWIGLTGAFAIVSVLCFKKEEKR